MKSFLTSALGSNYQTKYLLSSLHFSLHSQQLLGMYQPQTHKEPMHAYNVTESDWKLLAPARRVLSHFDIVGRTEEMQAFMDAIDRTLQLPPYKHPAAHHSNTHRKRYYNLSVEHTCRLRYVNRVDQVRPKPLPPSAYTGPCHVAAVPPSAS